MSSAIEAFVTIIPMLTVKGGLQSHLMCRVWVGVDLIEQKETVNIYKSWCGRGRGSGPGITPPTSHWPGLDNP